MVNPVRSTPGFYTRDQQSWLCGRSRGHVTTIRSRKGGRTVEVVDRGRWLFITLEHSPVQRDRFSTLFLSLFLSAGRAYLPPMAVPPTLSALSLLGGNPWHKKNKGLSTFAVF